MVATLSGAAVSTGETKENSYQIVSDVAGVTKNIIQDVRSSS